MMKKISYFLILAFIFSVSCAKNRPIKNCETYAEAPDPDTTNYSIAWQSVEGFNISFGSINDKYPKSSVPSLSHTVEWKTTAWKGERVSAQVVLWSAQTVGQIECEFSDFKGDNGKSMDASIAKARFVRYVITDIFGPGCAYREDLPPSLTPDALDNVDCFDMEGKTTRPVWLTFDIPADATPGEYKGTLKVYARNQKTKDLKISIEVLPQTLPEPKDWVFHLDLWQHPAAIARINEIKPWSEEHWQLMKEPMAMLADAGQKVITATLNKDPWNNQCYDRYEDMILWKKNKDNTWEYDYSVFDRWVEMMMELGIKDMINCYSMAPWNNELHYYDEAKRKQIDISAAPGSKEFKEIWTPFLKDFSRHLKEKGWLQITNIAMDERSPEIMKATLGLLKQVAPELGVALADNHKSYKEYPYLKDICVEYGATFDASDLQYRKQNNLISTYYVYCATKFPNVFTCSEPAEAVYISWYAVAAGYDGFLRWAYNSWPEKPLEDSRFRTWPAGDTYIVYPGNRSSIRFERLREGIQDAEKIRILRDKFKKASDTEKLNILENEISRFNVTGEPAALCSAMVDNAKQVLEELSR